MFKNKSECIQYLCLRILAWMHHLIILVPSELMTDLQKESGLEMIDYLAVTENVTSCTKKAIEKNLTLK